VLCCAALVCCFDCADSFAPSRAVLRCAVLCYATLVQEMYGEMVEQHPRIEGLQDRAAATHDQLGTLARDARRI
jgi:hypothetical protein